MRNLFRNKEKIIHVVLLSIICIVLAILSYRGIARIGIVNLVFILFAGLYLREALADENNKEKVAPLWNAVVVSIIAMILNIELHDTTSDTTFLKSILNWCTVWILITAGVFFYLSVILYRNKRWTQNEYEEWKRLKKERKLKNKKESENYKVEKTKAWVNHKRRKMEFTYETKEIKRENRRKKLERGRGKSVRLEKCVGVVVVIITVFLLVSFISIPYLNSKFNGFIERWILNIASLMGAEIKPLDNTETLSRIAIVANYTIFYVAIVGVAFLSFMLLFVVAKKIAEKFHICQNPDKKEQSDFFNEYGTPISILIVGLSVLISFVGNHNFKLVELIWESLLPFLLSIIVIFVAVDIIRLILEQCLIENSLLRVCIRYIYILFINTAMDIILGVFSGLRASEWISSIISLLIPVSNSELHEKIDQYIKKVLKKETEEVVQGKRKKETQKFKKRFQPFRSQTKNIR